MNTTLSGYLDAVRHDRLTIDAARTAIEAWPAYRPGERQEKQLALETLAQLEIERLGKTLRARRQTTDNPK